MKNGNRYGRLAQVAMVGPGGVEVLQRSPVAVVGVGNLGGQVIHHLAMMGIPMLLVDRDVVAGENLGTQGFEEAHLGLPKVVARARALARLNPGCRVTPIHADVARLGQGALRHAALIVSCLDNRPARVVVNEVARRLGVPWVDGAVDGEGGTALGRVAAYGAAAQAACYLCPHDQASLRELLKEDEPAGCSGWRWDREAPGGAPTVTLSATGGAVAAAQVTWGLEILLGRGSARAGHEMYLDVAAGFLATHALERNPDCLFDHRQFQLTPMGRRPAEITVDDTFARAEQELGAGLVLRLHRTSVATELRCPRCARTRGPHRLLEAMAPDEARCGCGEFMQPTAPGLLDRFTRSEAAPFLDRTWAELGLPDDDVVTAWHPDTGCELHLLVAEQP